MRQRGFTLLELIVAMLVFSLFAVMAYGGLRSVLDSRLATETHLSRLSDLQMAVGLFRRDLAELIPYWQVDEEGKLTQALQYRRGQLDFIRGGYPNPQQLPRSNLLQLSYRLAGDELVRFSKSPVYSDQKQEKAPPPTKTIVLSGLSLISYRFLDAKQQWHANWPPSSTLLPGMEPAEANALPTAVEVTLVLEKEGEFRFLVTTPGSASETAGDPLHEPIP